MSRECQSETANHQDQVMTTEPSDHEIKEQSSKKFKPDETTKDLSVVTKLKELMSEVSMQSGKANLVQLGSCIC